MCRTQINTLRTKLGRAMTKEDGFRCDDYFDLYVQNSSGFDDLCTAQSDSQLIKQLEIAAKRVLGKQVNLDLNQALAYDAADNLWFLPITLAGCWSRLLYFSDLLKGQVYIATSDDDYEVYYFSRRGSWQGNGTD